MKGKPRLILIPCALGVGLALTLLRLLSGACCHPQPARAAAGVVYCVTPGGGTYAACSRVFTDVQAAVDAAGGGEEIRIAAGTYTGVRNAPGLNTDTFTATQVLVITKSLTIRGGYSPSDWAAADPDSNPTALDAQGLGRVLVITGVAPLVASAGPSGADPLRASTTQAVSPRVEGFRLIGGDATGLGGDPSGLDAGGGVYVWGAAATVSDCLVSGNTASTADWGFGGGVFLAYSDAVLMGNTVQSNTASTAFRGRGGGVYLYGSDATVSNNTVMSNTASTASTASGGGIGLWDSSATLSANTVRGNTAGSAPYGQGFGYGGGIYANRSDGITLEGNEVQGNLARTLYRGYGGGIYLSSSDAMLVGNTIVGNVGSETSHGEGGGILVRGDVAMLEGNTIVSNVATLNEVTIGYGGGLLVDQSRPFTLTNNLVADNHASTQGGGLWVGGTYAPTSGRLLHTTVAGNVGGSGQGIYVESDASLAFANTIIAGHPGAGITVTKGSTVTLEATLWHGNGLDVGGTGAVSTGTVNIHGDPRFRAPTSGDYHLSARSAAIDGGLDVGVNRDLDGDVRPIGRPDLGAYEWGMQTYMPMVLRHHGP